MLNLPLLLCHMIKFACGTDAFILWQSTYCSSLYQHCQTIGRTIHVINLDPAADNFDYPVATGKCKAYLFFPL